ncbi:MAG: hypothetical protein P4L90_13570 [Rhodopila sp.]|nr:hypothetical protein [Rhodopila sp.]
MAIFYLSSMSYIIVGPLISVPLLRLNGAVGAVWLEIAVHITEAVPSVAPGA